MFDRNNRENSLIGYVYSVRPLEYLTKKLPVLAKCVTVILIGSNHSAHCYVCYWHVLVCLKSVQRYTFFILDTFHPDALSLREQRCEDPWLFFVAKWGSRAELFGKPHFKELFLKLWYINQSTIVYW
jgi:hypothetical protein